MYRAGLVLEGGGMKGIYTAGVLDFFLEKGLLFDHVYGVSAGACHMCSYLSGQQGRARDITIDYLDSDYYCSAKSLLLTGDLFNVEMCYHTIPDYLYPFDNEAYERYEGKAYSVVTNMETGEPEYMAIKDLKVDIDKIRASASLPLVARKVKIGEKYYLDGGISDAIPIQKSILDGNRKNIVIMTKEEGYVRKPIGAKEKAALRARYLKYPRIPELMEQRHVAYNGQVEYLERQKQNGQAFVIRPQKASPVGRIEKDKEKMLLLYEEGYEDAKSQYEKLMAYLADCER